MKERICSVCGSNHHTRNTPIGCLCGRHSCQYYRYGKVLERSRSDKNQIIDYNDKSCYMLLYNKTHECIAKTLIDKSDLDLVRRYKWSYDGNGYAQTVISDNGKFRLQRLHRLILNNPHGIVDHINGDRLDNRRCNLRIGTRADNAHNITSPSTSNSGFHGVSFIKRIGKWQAKICVNHQYIFLGNFKKLEDAILVRKEAEKKYYGEFAPLNYNKQNV